MPIIADWPVPVPHPAQHCSVQFVNPERETLLVLTFDDRIKENILQLIEPIQPFKCTKNSIMVAHISGGAQRECDK